MQRLGHVVPGGIRVAQRRLEARACAFAHIVSHAPTILPSGGNELSRKAACTKDGTALSLI